MSATAVRCTVCGGSTTVRADSVRQRCDFCSAEFLWQATHAAAGAAEHRVTEELARIQHELDALDAEALRCAAANDHTRAHQVVSEHVRRVGAIYEHTGYYRLMGVETPDEIERNRGFAFQLHLARLGLATQIAREPEVPGHAAMTRALAAYDFDEALAGYRAMVAHQVDHDPRWRDRDPVERQQICTSAIRTFALGIPWARDDDFARHRIELARPAPRADGTHSVTCVQCGAEVVLAQLVEAATCSYCNATFRLRLDGLALYHARGHADVTAAEQASIATQLGLGAPRSCRTCSGIVAPAPGTTACPMCTSKL